jgi:ABC-type glycerol-3-phosphate transport system substrate-binding protein
MKLFIRMISAFTGLILSSTVFAVTTITFDAWMWSEPNFKPMVEAVVAGFEKENPGIKVEMRGGGWSETRQKLLMRAAGGDAEDVMMLDAEWFYSLGSSGVLQDLNEIASKDFLADLNQGALSTYLIDGEQVAVPSALTPWGMWTNQELMKKYNLKPNETWNDVLDNCQTLKNAGAKAQMMTLNGTSKGSTIEFNLYQYWNFNVYPLDPEAIKNKKTGLDVPEYRTMLSTLRKLKKNDCIAAFGGDPRNAFSHYETVTHFDGPYFLGIARQSNPEKFGGDKIFDVLSVEPNPVLKKGEKPKVSGLGHAMAISAQSEHQEEAMRFLEYWVSSDKGIDLYTTPMGAITPSMKGQNSRKAEVYQNPIHQGFLNDVLPYLQAVPLSDEWPTCGKILSDAQMKAVLTDDPIEDLVKRADEICAIILGL